MKIYTTGDFHHKNRKGMDLVPAGNIFPWKGETDGILLCNELKQDILFRPDITRLILGPGIAFTEAVAFFRQYRGDKNVVFNCLSPWNRHLHERDGHNSRVQYVCIPFPVDTDKFQPAYPKKKRFFVYFKHVHSQRLRIIMDFLSSRQELAGYEYTVFTYGQYHEDLYLDYIKQSAFGVWVGSHESQGFALEEALSCDCPLFVYDVNSTKDECVGDVRYPWGHLQGEYPATTASYFDETCGIVVKKNDEFQDGFQRFYNSVLSGSVFRTREFVKAHFSTEEFCQKIRSYFPEDSSTA